MVNVKKTGYGQELVPECKGCIFADKTKFICSILTEPGWFWRDGKACSFRKDKKQ
ncbi:MAG TPA: hypothetical protein GX401_09180 [Clostridiales bacterium]|jgi:hypothetical protein|nr:hypothetical protein [Clostridiales bacterium]